ncbi:hypothetical protein MMPV_005330 [Pyropia vietnamensis]
MSDSRGNGSASGWSSAGSSAGDSNHGGRGSRSIGSNSGSSSGSTTPTSASSTDDDQAAFVAAYPALRRNMAAWAARRSANRHTTALWAGHSCGHRAMIYHRLAHYYRYAAGAVRRRAVALLGRGSIRVALPPSIDDRDRVVHAVTTRLVRNSPLLDALRSYLDDVLEEARVYRRARRVDFFANPSPRLRLLRQHLAATGEVGESDSASD